MKNSLLIILIGGVAAITAFATFSRGSIFHSRTGGILYLILLITSMSLGVYGSLKYGCINLIWYFLVYIIVAGFFSSFLKRTIFKN